MLQDCKACANEVEGWREHQAEGKKHIDDDLRCFQGGLHRFISITLKARIKNFIHLNLSSASVTASLLLLFSLGSPLGEGDFCNLMTFI